MAEGRRRRRGTSVQISSSEAQPVVDAALQPQLIGVDKLRPHPRNYRGHPPEQIAHIQASLREHGFYRNLVVAPDPEAAGHYVILAGHGVEMAARQMGATAVPAIIVPIDPFSIQALKILAGDNEISNTAADNERVKLEILKDIKNGGLLEGTGFDGNQLAELIFTCSMREEVPNMNAARLWLGMPEHEEGESKVSLVISFATEEDRDRFVSQYGISLRKKARACWSAFWPNRPRAGLRDLAWAEEEGA